ncbi:hypothetical protein GGTG_00189 [Gaeumannomyces tritici R3-111a-1]|uniref:Uncharacterized protein n=1 Tax=Gaeumannomyces tritici (strain R3-111a-1) TaxID=644352 RepID=J3NFZ6_GAET3|nr:hypothetical protein GGTG_00189 [Gaeumannomyces tritici R3-111a-1]EJT80186.1 hypothetical protein GGTG_00189 [Gaeumannomyces tritici R3-111a-1]
MCVGKEEGRSAWSDRYQGRWYQGAGAVARAVFPIDVRFLFARPSRKQHGEDPRSALDRLLQLGLLVSAVAGWLRAAAKEA